MKSELSLDAEQLPAAFRAVLEEHTPGVLEQTPDWTDVSD